MKNIINCEKAPAALGPYNHACEANGFVFTSGQLGIDPSTGKLVEGVEAQARQALINIENVLSAAGATMKDVLKATVFVVDLGDFATVNKVYNDQFGSDFPGRSCLQVAKLPAGGLVEIEVVAFKG
ncbi:MAG: Rid family detoxifying hydrolase [Clostridia bacterium]|nr:Rid family detoxifying hydrolase [Clostridia bacterium]